MSIKAGSGRSLTPSQSGSALSLVQVGQRCGKSNIATLGASKPYASFHQRVVFPNGADAIQLVYPNYEITNAFSQSKSEYATAPSMYQASSVTYSGGSGYAVGNVDTFAVTTTTGIAPVKVLITNVASGVPTSVQIIDGGLYNTPLSAGASPASTSGSGTGATATFTWNAGSLGMHVCIEPVFGNLVANGGGAGAFVTVSKGGLLADSTLATSLLVPEGDFLVTDLISVDIPVGGAVGIRTSLGYNTVIFGRPLLNATTGPTAPAGNYEAFNASTTFTDLSSSGSFAASTANEMMTPVLILGIPKQQSPTVMAVADSRCAGMSSGPAAISTASTLFDVLDKDGNVGWFEKALSGTLGRAFWPWSNLAMQGDMLLFWLGVPNQGRFGRMKALGMARPTAVYLGLNVNDLNHGSSLALVKNQEQQIIGELRGLGIKYVFTDTTDPYTSSTDNWATTANQAATTYSANITARNMALASGTWATYDFFIDQRPNSESSVNSGKWAVNGSAGYGTGDGLHAAPAVIALKASTAAGVIAGNISL